MRRAGTGMALAVMLLSEVPSAQAGPKLIPDRDVDIGYRVSMPDEPAFNRRVRWQASSQLERVDGPGNAIVIMDHRTHYETLLRSENRTYLKIRVPPDGILDPSPDVPRTSTGQAKIAGLPCTEWNWTTPEDQKPLSICVTDDGVLLRERMDGHIVIQATSVHYRKLKPSTFAVPDNFEPSLAPGGLVE